MTLLPMTRSGRLRAREVRFPPKQKRNRLTTQRGEVTSRVGEAAPHPPRRARAGPRAEPGAGRALPYNHRRGTGARGRPSRVADPSGEDPAVRRAEGREPLPPRRGARASAPHTHPTRPPPARGDGDRRLALECGAPSPQPHGAPGRAGPSEGGLPGGKGPESATPTRRPPSLPALRPQSLPRFVLTAVPLPKPLDPRAPPLHRRRHCQGRGAAGRQRGGRGTAPPPPHPPRCAPRAAAPGLSPTATRWAAAEGSRPTVPFRAHVPRPRRGAWYGPLYGKHGRPQFPAAGRPATSWRMSRRATAHALLLYW